MPILIPDNTQMEKTGPDKKRKDTPGPCMTKKGKNQKLKKKLLSSILEREHSVFENELSDSETVVNRDVDHP